MAEGLGLPKRWLDCPRKGDIVEDIFIPSKTPLDGRYTDQMETKNLFTPNMHIESLKGLGHRIGLWVDLTYTDRFYNYKDIEDKGIRYVKLRCRGHNECPSSDITREFIYICRKFLAERDDTNAKIAVHCTHGFNRTGFLISSFLVAHRVCDIATAVEKFAAAREPGIYKQEYLRVLFKNYDLERNCPQAPALPKWCFGEDQEDDDGPHNGNRASSSNGHPRGDSRTNGSDSVPQFMEGVSGVSTVTSRSQMSYVQNQAREMCNFRKNAFPGCQPVSMSFDNIELLKRKNYKVSWKADGTRYLMLILDEKNIYFLDRDNSVFQAEGVKFPKRKDLSQFTKNTLMDGEMVIDEFEGRKISRYLIYDIIKFEGDDVGGCDFDRRLLCISKEIIKPREEAKVLPEHDHRRIDRAQEPFSIRLKEFWDLSQTSKLFTERFMKNVVHEIDGLIFQPVDEKYKAGRCDQALKWKPPSHNSIDFRLIVTDDDTVGLLYVNGDKTPFGRIALNDELRILDRKIIECNWNFETRRWMLMRERTDKSFPNHITTANAVWDSIANPVTKDILLDFIHEHRWRPPVKKLNHN